MDPEQHRDISRRGGEASGGNVENLRNQGRSQGGGRQGGTVLGWQEEEE